MSLESQIAETRIIEDLRESIRITAEIIEGQIPLIVAMAELISASLKSGHKVLFFGNGGSAADAQHLAAEFVGKFLKERRALPGLALTTNTSILTAIGNDYGYESVFSRQIEAFAAEGDVVVGISTSGKSPNVLRAFEAARARGARCIGLTGRDGAEMSKFCDLCFQVPSGSTPRIQEAHICVGHIICDLVERSNS